MNRGDAERWRFTQWAVAVGVLLLAQVGALYALSRKSSTSDSAQPSAFVLHLSPVPLDDAALAEIFLVRDPTLFAIPSGKGFSGEAWLKPPQPDYTTAGLSQDRDASFWLALDTNQLGSGLRQAAQSGAPSFSPAVTDPRPRLPFVLPGPPVSEQKSVMEVAGNLANRAVVNLPSAPSWAHTNILVKSTVQIAVDQQGLVVAARLIERSGSDQADRAAVSLARNARFELDAAPITFGQVSIHWNTLPVENVTTNAAPP